MVGGVGHEDIVQSGTATLTDGKRAAVARLPVLVPASQHVAVTVVVTVEIVARTSISSLIFNYC